MPGWESPPTAYYQVNSPSHLISSFSFSKSP
jgi:hypothetical protein